MLRVLLSRIRGTFRRHQLDDEFDEELRAHLEMLQERFIRRGMEPKEAFYAARRQFGGVTQVKQDLRQRRASADRRCAAAGRSTRVSTASEIEAIHGRRRTDLALGIGATTAVFAVLDTVVLKPLPYAEPDRLMAFRSLDRRGSRPTQLSYPNFLDFRRENRVFEHLVSYRDAQFTLTDSLPAVSVTGEIVSWDLFPMLGIQPALGRGFRPDEEQPGTHVAVLSHALWMNRFGGNRDILGKAIPVNGVPFTVIGVAPEGFQFPMDVPGRSVVGHIVRRVHGWQPAWRADAGCRRPLEAGHLRRTGAKPSWTWWPGRWRVDIRTATPTSPPRGCNLNRSGCRALPRRRS